MQHSLLYVCERVKWFIFKNNRLRDVATSGLLRRCEGLYGTGVGVGEEMNAGGEASWACKGR